VDWFLAVSKICLDPLGARRERLPTREVRRPNRSVQGVEKPLPALQYGKFLNRRPIAPEQRFIFKQGSMKNDRGAGICWGGKGLRIGLDHSWGLFSPSCHNAVGTNEICNGIFCPILFLFFDLSLLGRNEGLPSQFAVIGNGKSMSFVSYLLKEVG